MTAAIADILVGLTDAQRKAVLDTVPGKERLFSEVRSSVRISLFSLGCFRHSPTNDPPNSGCYFLLTEVGEQVRTSLQAQALAKKLTEAQRDWLEEITDTETGLYCRMHIPAGYGGGINGLLKKGFIEWTNKRRQFLRATALGRQVRDALIREAASLARTGVGV